MKKKYLFALLILPEFLLAQGGRAWGTYYGGTNFDYGYSTATDPSGNVYVAGLTMSTTGIASGGFQNTFGGTSDAFLVKFDALGNRLWATYYGGSQDDIAYNVTTDAAGNVYVTGLTASTTGIASGGFQNSYGGGIRDAFLVKFNSAGARLWATYYGGTGWDRGYGVSTDAAGNVYMAGWTNSASGIASVGSYQSTLAGGDDAFLVKFNSAGVRQWATYLGGAGIDDANMVATDPAGNVYITGQTQSASGIASGGFQNTYGGGYDGFLSKFDGSGGLLWSTYYGGSGDDRGYSVATDAANNVYLAGNSGTTTGMTSGGYQNVYGGGAHDALLVKFDPSGGRTWATYYGGPADDDAISVTVDASANIFLAGFAVSTTGISSGGFQNTFGGGPNDAMLEKFDAAGNLQCATYYGGPGDESGYIGCGVSTDGTGNVYLCGQTASTTGIASGGFQNTYGGGFNDAFFAKLTTCTNALLVSTASTNIPCNGQCNGSAACTASGGTSPYTYLWSPGGQTTSTASGLCAGTYTITVTDFTTATATATVTITQPAPLTVSTSQVNLLCNAVCNGTANVTASGGTTGYTYSWNTTPVQTTANATGLCAGNYTVTVTDANNCVSTQSVNITQPPAITSSTSSNPASCGNNNGSATISVSGGTSPYTYLWNNAQTGSTASSLTAGNYTVTITDANGCTQTASVNVNNSNGPNMTLSQTNILCNGQCTGTASATVSGGSTPYSYLWSNAATTQNISALCVGSYTVTVTDLNGCSVSQAVTITAPPAITSSSSSSPSTCGNNNGSATISVSGGTSPYTYLWSNSQTGATSSGLSAGTYTVTITDANGCTQTQTVAVTSSGGFTASGSSTQSSCSASTGTATVNVTGGTTPFSYSWSNGQTTQTATGLAGGTYTVTVTDANNCTQTQTVSVAQAAGPTASASASLTSIAAGDSSLLSASGGVSYQWNPSTGLSCTTCTNPTATPSQTTTYCVIVTDANNCTDSACVTITVIEPPCNLQTLSTLIPNAFSPNSDGINDRFCVPANACIASFTLTIYDRWGEKVFESSSLADCWEGTYKGKILNSGVFAYYFNAVLSNGDTFKQKGNISLLR